MEAVKDLKIASIFSLMSAHYQRRELVARYHSPSESEART